MSKTYSTPALIVKGSIIDLTLGPIAGNTESDETRVVPFGSAGFGL